MIKAFGYATKHSFSRLKPYKFEREAAGPSEVEVDVLYCGVCHTDIHQAKNEFGNTVYPCMPGHEMTGRVRAIGSGITRHAVGDLVGIGCMVDSCRQCAPCLAGEENYCEGPNSFLATYNGPTIPAQMSVTGENMYRGDNTFGGYSDVMVVHEDFVLKIPAGMDAAQAAPILCAGVTTYSPLRYWKVGPGSKVGIVGLGGLGHMAVKLAVAIGAEVTVFTTSAEKRQAAEGLGATFVEMEKDAKSQMMKRAGTVGSFDFILSTIPQKHDLNPFIVLLKRHATIVAIGSMDPMAPVNNLLVNFHRRNISGSLIGSLRETQEVLDFCTQHDIRPDIEIISIQDINDAYKKVESGDVRFRYVIDLASLRSERGELV